MLSKAEGVRAAERMALKGQFVTGRFPSIPDAAPGRLWGSEIDVATGVIGEEDMNVDGACSLVFLCAFHVPQTVV